MDSARKVASASGMKVSKRAVQLARMVAVTPRIVNVVKQGNLTFVVEVADESVMAATVSA